MATLLIEPVVLKRSDNQVQVNLGSIRDEYIVSLEDPSPSTMKEWGCVDETKAFMASMNYPIVRVFRIDNASETKFYDVLPDEIYGAYLNEIDWNDDKLAGIAQQVKYILQRQGILLKDEKEVPEEKVVLEGVPLKHKESSSETTRQLVEKLFASVKDQRIFTVKQPRGNKKSRQSTNKLFVFTRDFSSEELEEINHYDDVQLVPCKSLDHLAIDSGIEIHVDNIDKLTKEVAWWSKA